MRSTFLIFLFLVMSLSYVTAQEITLSGATGGLASASQNAGSTNVAIFGITLAKAAGGTSSFTAIEVQLSENPNLVFTNARLIRSNDGTFDLSDLANVESTGSFTTAPNAIVFDESPLTITTFGGGANAVSRNYFVVVDIIGNAPNTTVQATADNTNITAGSTVNAGTVAGPTYTINAKTTTIASLNTVATHGVAMSPLVAEATNKAVFGFSLTSTATQTLTELRIQGVHTGKVESFSLVSSTDANFTTTGNNTTIGGLTFDASVASEINITGLNENITTSAKNYFLVATVASGADNTMSYQASLTSTNVTLTEGVAAGSATGILYAFEELAGTVNQQSGGVSNTLVTSDNNKALIGFNFTSNGPQTITGATITLSAAASTLKLNNLELFESATATYNGTGSVIASTGNGNLSEAAGVITITSITATTSSYYFLIADVDGTAVPVTFDVELTSVTPGSGSISGIPLSNTNISITGLSNTLTAITSAPVVASGSSIVSGTDLQAIGGFSLSSNGSPTVTNVNFNVTNNGNVQTFYLYRVENTAATLAGATVLSSGASSNFTISDNMPNGSIYYYYLVADINPIATGTSIITISEGNVTIDGTSTAFSVNQSYSFTPASATIIADDAGEYTNIGLTEYSKQTLANPGPGTNLTTANSTRVFSITVEDDNVDGFPTTLNALSFSVTNANNLAAIALFDGSTNVKELAVPLSGVVDFTSLNIPIASGTTVDLDIRVTFKPSITDNQQMVFTLESAASVPGAGLSQLASYTAGSITSSTTAGRNTFRVDATKLVFIDPASLAITATLPPQSGSAFSVTVAAVDANNNLDLNNTAEVTLNISPSASVTFTGGGPATLSSGTYTYTSLTINKSDTYDLNASCSSNCGGGLTATSAGMGTSVTVIIQSAGIAVTAAADLAACKVGASANYSTLPNIVISETDNADFVSGSGYTFLLILPSGWEFRTTGTTPTMGYTAGQNFTSAVFNQFVTPSIAKFTYTISGTNKPDVVTISGFEVRNVEGLDGFITRGGTGIIIGCCDDDKPLGTLTTPGGSTADFTVEASPGEAQIAATTTSFSVFSKPIILNGEAPAGNPVTTGTFSGPGVTLKTFGDPINGSRYTFNPGTLNDGFHNVTFEFTDSGSGCITSVTKPLEVYSGAITNLESTYCAGDNDEVDIEVNPSFIPANSTVVTQGGEDAFSIRIPDIKYIKDVINNAGTLTLEVTNHGLTDGGQYDIFIGYGFAGPDAPYGYVYNSFTIDVQDDDHFNITANVTGAWDKLYGEIYLNITYYFYFENAVIANATTVTITATDHGFKDGARPFLQLYGIFDNGQQIGGFYEVSNVTANTFDISVTNPTGAYSSGYAYYNWYRVTSFVPNITLLNSKLADVKTYEVGYFVRYSGCVGFGCDWNVVNSQEVALFPLPNASFTGLLDFYCANNNSPQTLTGNLNYPDGQFTISPNFGLVDGGSGNYTATFLPSASGITEDAIITVTYTLTDARGCTNSSSKETIVHEVPTVSAGPNHIICNGVSPASLGGSPTATSPTVSDFKYVWTPAASLDRADVSNPFASPTSNTTYTVEAFDKYGCSSTDNVQVTVNTPATVNAGPPSVTICEGTTLTLNTLAGLNIGGSATTATWSTPPAIAAGDFRDNSSATNRSYGSAVTFHPTASDVTNTFVIISLTTNDPDGAGVGCNPAYDEVRVEIHPKPAAPAVPDAMPLYCVDDVLKDLTSTGSSVRWYNDAALGNLEHSGSTFPTNIRVQSDVDAIHTFYVTQTNPTTSFAGCESDPTVVVITINPKPQPMFTAANFCEGDATAFDASGSTVTYNNGGSGTITGYEWNFNDRNGLPAGSGAILEPESNGGATTGTYDAPAHRYASIGSYNVRLTVHTSDGCSNMIDAITALGNQVRIGPVPQPAFNYQFICKDDITVFTGSANNVPLAQVDTYEWNFGDGTVIPQSTPNSSHVFANTGTYGVTLTITTDLGCVGSIAKGVPILPYIKTFPYSQPFENADHGWAPQAHVFTPENNGAHSWERLAPYNSFGDIKMDAADNYAWFTRVTSTSTYNNAERSVLNGPCIDVTALERPLLSFDYWNSTDIQNDGVYMEVSTNNGLTWDILGDVGTGLEWYNESAIKGLTRVAGIGQNVGQNGWSGKTGAWKTAKLTLDDFRDETKLRVRFVFGSNPDNPSVGTYDGFAMDNFNIKSRNRTMLVENFTSSFEGVNNDAFYNFKSDLTESELVKIQYHTGLQSQVDDIYYQNNEDVDARVAYYGLTNENTIPRVFLDGASSGSFNPNAAWGDQEFSKRSLSDSPFKIGIDTKPDDPGNLRVALTVNAEGDVANDGRVPVLYIAILEKVIGTDRFVLRKMLPSAAGYKIPLPLTDQQVVELDDFVWSVDNDNVDLSNLSIVAFIQDMKTKQVDQAAARWDPLNLPSIITGTESSLASQVLMFPNPANSLVQIKLPQKVRENIPFVIYDSFGKEVHGAEFKMGDDEKVVSTKEFKSGLYIVELRTTKGMVRKKLMVVHD